MGYSVRMFIPVVLMAVFSATSLAETSSWTPYHNMRFGTTVDVPKGWHAGPPPENNDGRVFTSPDGAAQLTVSGMLNVEDSLETAFAFYETPEQGETMTYKHRARNSVTVSGTKGDKIFYAKHLLSCRDRVWNSVDLEYPASRKAELDALVAHVARSLRPGAGYQIRDCMR